MNQFETGRSLVWRVTAQAIFVGVLGAAVGYSAWLAAQDRDLAWSLAAIVWIVTSPILEVIRTIQSGDSVDRSPQSAARFRVADRPSSAKEDIDVLLPPHIGSFARSRCTSEVPKADSPIYSEYRSGSRMVFVELGIYDDVAGAKMALATAMSEIHAECPEASEGKGETNYFRTANARGAFAAWIAGANYYSAHASGGDSDLDELLAVFPRGPAAMTR